jgi:hypothetical protein
MMFRRVFSPLSLSLGESKSSTSLVAASLRRPALPAVPVRGVGVDVLSTNDRVACSCALEPCPLGFLISARFSFTRYCQAPLCLLPQPLGLGSLLLDPTASTALKRRK